MSRDVFFVATIVGQEQEVGTGIWWVEARDTNKQPTVHRTAPQRRSR